MAKVESIVNYWEKASEKELDLLEKVGFKFGETTPETYVLVLDDQRSIRKRTFWKDKAQRDLEKVIYGLCDADGEVVCKDIDDILAEI